MTRRGNLRPPAAFAMALAAMAVSACGDQSAGDAGAAYLGAADARRMAMEESLAGVDNGYARLRRAHYATGVAGDWERLPVWNPRVSVVSMAALRAATTMSITGAAAFVGEPADSLDLTSGGVAAAAVPAVLRALGEAAFFRYPAQLLPSNVILAVAELAQYGLWRDEVHGVGGLVQAAMADGSARLAMTCATCHATDRPGGETLVPGLGNSALDLGRWLADTAERAENVVGDRAPADTSALRAWGRGRVDVATVDGRLPVNLPDLRPTRFLTHLHYEADVAQQSIASLAVRIETLLITSHGQALRPPRAVALGLAYYLWSLGETVPRPPGASASPGGEPDPGAVAFRATCAMCHAGVGLTGPPVDAARVGTDATAAFDPERGTGRYRVPSLRGVSARGALMHDGSIAGLPALLDPARLSGAGAVPGHPFGTGLDDVTRAALLDHLRQL